MIKNKLFSSGELVTLATGQTYTVKDNEVFLNDSLYRKSDLEISLNGIGATSDQNNCNVGIRKRDGNKNLPAFLSDFNEWEIDGVAQTALEDCIENINTAIYYDPSSGGADYDFYFSIDTSGTIVKFDTSRTYGNIALLEGSFIYDFTSAKFMCPVFLIHRSDAIQLPQGSIVVQGQYKPNQVNYIQLLYLNNSKILVYFNNIESNTTSELTWTETGSAFSSVTNKQHILSGTTTLFKDNYAITTETFSKGEGISFRATPTPPSTTVRLFVAFVNAVNSNYAVNTYSGFTIRAGELRVWNGTTTEFIVNLTDVTAKFTISIDQNNNCRFTSDIDGDFISAFNVPDGAFCQIWYGDEDGSIPSYPAGSANEFVISEIQKVTV